MKLMTALIATLSATPGLAEGVPGLGGPDRIEFTAPDLGAAVSLLNDGMGSDAFYGLGPFPGGDSMWMQDHVYVDPKAKITEIRIVRCSDGANLEIFQYSAPDHNTALPRHSDIGRHHIAFDVDDIAKAVDYLTSKGVKVLGQPTTMTEGPSKGETCVFFLAPWEMQLELVSYPMGKAYEADFPNRLWDPRS
jgi:catechol 2,3-dioxygenase-like lactoylglutathione lyase family enzyme